MGEEHKAPHTQSWQGSWHWRTSAWDQDRIKEERGWEWHCDLSLR